MTILVLSDLIFDVFTFLRRKELDMLQAVNRRFNDVILRKMTLLCLRHIRHGEIEPSAKLNQYLLAFEVDVLLGAFVLEFFLEAVFILVGTSRLLKVVFASVLS